MFVRVSKWVIKKVRRIWMHLIFQMGVGCVHSVKTTTFRVELSVIVATKPKVS